MTPRRLTAAAEARAVGRGGITLVSAIYGMSRGTIYRGLDELKATTDQRIGGRIRRPVAGGTVGSTTIPPSARRWTA